MRGTVKEAHSSWTGKTNAHYRFNQYLLCKGATLKISVRHLNIVGNISPMILRKIAIMHLP